jgi:hypothetical protein
LQQIQIEYLARMDSIEGAYIGISRCLLDHGPQLGWFLFGMRGSRCRTAIRRRARLLRPLRGMVQIYLALAHHQVSAALHCLGPITVFLLAGRLARDWRLGLSAGITYCLLCPSTLISRSVGTFVGSSWDPAAFFRWSNSEIVRTSYR